MENVFSLLKRFLTVPLGYVAASFASSLVLLIASLMFDNRISDGTAADHALRSFLIMNLYFILWPAVVGILFSEALAIRSWKFHVLNIAASALFGWLAYGALVRWIPFGQMIAAGIVGGFAYWVVAGSTAGFFKPIPGSDPPPSVPATTQ